MRHERMIIEVQSPGQIGYGRVRLALAERSLRDRKLAGIRVDRASLANVPLHSSDHASPCGRLPRRSKTRPG